MIVVTGGAGFIGSNLIRALNQRGRSDILLIEDFSDGHRFRNLADCVVADYFEHDHALQLMESGDDLGATIDAVYHLGACSDTTEWDGRLMMQQNFRFSRALFNHCVSRQIPLVYASSAAVYGASKQFSERAENESPLNVYGYSKLVFDQYVRQQLGRVNSLVIGLRYFNVYGPREQHKGRMASVLWHFNEQLKRDGEIRLFDASHGYAAGEQQRDFVHVDDVVETTLWCATQAPADSGIYNCGTGRAASFNQVARVLLDWHGHGAINYIPFPGDLNAAYQAYTCADLSYLRASGFAHSFRDINDGIAEYLNWLNR